MKKFNLVLLALAFVVSSTVSAATQPKTESGTKSNSDISQEIGKLLKKPSFAIGYNDLTAKVVFTVNRDNEIVVLSIDSESDTVKNFVKDRLNYQKLSVRADKSIKEFTVPVRIVPE